MPYTLYKIKYNRLQLLYRSELAGNYLRGIRKYFFFRLDLIYLYKMYKHNKIK